MGQIFVKWPVATDEHRRAERGWLRHCTGLVMVHTDDARAGTVDYTIEYYTLGHFTKFVPNGAIRIRVGPTIQKC